MTADARNFRSKFLEKVGFRGVEEKKSLDMLLKERPVDLKRLQNVCLRSTVPVIYRSLVWRLLLGVLPLHNNNTQLVWQQRTEQWRELKATLEVTKKITSTTSPPEACCLVWLLETRQLKFDVMLQLEETRNKNFIAIASSLYAILDSGSSSAIVEGRTEETKDEEVYWVCKGLFKFLDDSLKDIRSISDCFSKVMKEDLVLYNHLDKIGAITSLPYYSLIGSGMAGSFPPVLLEKLWDKVISGSVRVLVYVLVAAVCRCRADVLAADTSQEVERLVAELKEDRAEVVMTSGLDMWADDGCPLLCINRQMSGGEGNPASADLMAPLVGVPIRRPSLQDEMETQEKIKLEQRRSAETVVKQL